MSEMLSRAWVLVEECESGVMADGSTYVLLSVHMSEPAAEVARFAARGGACPTMLDGEPHVFSAGSSGWCDYCGAGWAVHAVEIEDAKPAAADPHAGHMHLQIDESRLLARGDADAITEAIRDLLEWVEGASQHGPEACDCARCDVVGASYHALALLGDRS